MGTTSVQTTPKICFQVARDKVLSWLDPDPGYERVLYIAFFFNNDPSATNETAFTLSKIYYVENEEYVGFKKVDFEENDYTLFEEEETYVYQEIPGSLPPQYELIKVANSNVNPNQLYFKLLDYFPQTTNMDLVLMSDIDLRTLTANFNYVRFSGALLDFGKSVIDLQSNDAIEGGEHFAMKVEGINRHISAAYLDTALSKYVNPNQDSGTVSLPITYLAPPCPPFWYIQEPTIK